MDNSRARARELAKAAIQRGEPLAWFEELYRQNRENNVPIPWADLRPNPNLLELFEKLSHLNFGKHAMKVGCGLGDDAHWLSLRGFSLTAFDISPTAIDQCQRRFANAGIKFVTADLLQKQTEWQHAFDLVIESYTLQVLPPDLRKIAIKRLTEYLAPGGHLILIARARNPNDPIGDMPWPLLRAELDQFKTEGLTEIYFEDYLDRESPPVRRFQACYQQPLVSACAVE